MNLFVRFPKGTAGYNAIIKHSIAIRMSAAQQDGLILVHRTDDLFQAIWVTKDTWRTLCRAVKKHFPEATIVQYI